MEDNPFEQAAEDVAKSTDDKYAAEIAKLQAPSSETLGKLFPTPVDKQNLLALIEATRKATNEAEILSKLKDGASSLGLVAVKLLKTVIVA